MGLTSFSSGRGAMREFSALENPERLPVVALAGNPNVGKSTVFNALTGLKQHTGNWSGKTVSLASGRARSRDLLFVDLPGCYSLDPSGGEEAIARDYIVRGDAAAVIAIVDACCIERSLALALRVIALAPRTVVCLNLIDEAEKRGLRFDIALLSARLGVPVVPCAARSGRGLRELLLALDGVFSSKTAAPRAEYTRFLPVEGDAEASEAAAIECFRECSRIVDGAVRSEKHDRARGARRGAASFDRLATGRFTAFPMMLLLLALVFYLTLIGANYPSRALALLFERAEGMLSSLLARLNVAQWLSGALLAGAFRTLGWVVSVMLPPMAIFFPLFTLLEDLGYLPRAAFALDRCFRCCGACGKQALTISMGFGCNAAGVVGCRIIGSRGERLMAMLTNSLVPCNGRFPMLIALCALLLGGGSLGSLAAAGALAALIVLALGVTLGATLLLSKTLFRSERGAFLMELPPYRVPKLLEVLVRSMLDRTLHVLGRAAAVAAPAGIVIYALANIELSAGGPSLIAALCGALDPFARFFGLDGVIFAAFLLGFPANEIVLPIMLMIYTGGAELAEAVAGPELLGVLMANGWTPLTMVSVIIFTLFHWPCSTTCLTIRKEAGGLRWMLLGILLPTAIGLLLLAVLNGVARLLLPLA